MRIVMGVLAIASLMFVIYASLVPLRYTPQPMEKTIELFKKTPWLKLEISSRADWVANGLIMLPSGFLAAGAVDWRRKKRWALLIASPLLAVALVAVVFAIEFFQLWFPPRVVSQNDIFAGAIGFGRRDRVVVASWAICFAGIGRVCDRRTWAATNPNHDELHHGWALSL